jgi:AcrR family transcriptional regulator
MCDAVGAVPALERDQPPKAEVGCRTTDASANIGAVVPVRRFGSKTSATRRRLLDAALDLMLNEGYAAVSARRVATQAGFNQALVHYYFHTMDDLFLAIYEHRAEYARRLHAEALKSDQPLWALWEFNRDGKTTALTMELMALANHRKVIRSAIEDTVERFRADELKALKAICKRYSISEEEWSPVVALMIMLSVARFLAIEESFAMLGGHAETLAFVEAFICRLEGERRREP